MSRRKLERLLNLTLCLMATSRYLSVREIADLVEGYEPGESAESEVAFRRMFERDKEELRELGVPLEAGTPRSYDDEIGYRIPKRDYALPDLHLDADEAAALGLAARLWSSASLATASAGALRKLRAAGIDLQEVPAGVEPRVDVTEPAFEPCLAAVRDGRALRFAYRRPGGEAMTREVEPWGVVSWRGRWYLVGHDRGRNGTRVFRLGRVEGDVTAVGPRGATKPPEGVDLTAVVEDAEPRDLPEQSARLRLRAGTGWSLRRQYPPTSVTATDGDEEIAAEEITVAFRDVERLVDQLVALGPDIDVLEPDEVLDAVRRRHEATLAAHGDTDVEAAR